MQVLLINSLLLLHSLLQLKVIQGLLATIAVRAEVRRLDYVAPLLDLPIINSIGMNIRWIVAHALGHHFAFVHINFPLLLYCFTVEFLQISSLDQINTLHLLIKG